MSFQSLYQTQPAWRWLIGIGLLWMMLGMVLVPAGVSFNPSHGYEVSLGILLYLPTLLALVMRREAIWASLWAQPLFRVFLLLLAWAAMSLLWEHARRPWDELGRLLSVLIFVLAWQLWDVHDRFRVELMLLVASVALALCAAYYDIQYLLAPPADDRLVGDGTIATSNYAAALMGAVVVWLSQLPGGDARRFWLRCVACIPLLIFVGLTQSRSVWLALILCTVLSPLWRRRDYLISGLAVVVLVVATALVLFAPHVLVERGTSRRPELFTQAIHHIAQHPWLGLGQGAPFALHVAGMDFTHSHNVLTQTAIELGLPGLLLLVILWLMLGWRAWKQRYLLRGQVAMGLWVYASITLQFDMPQILDSPRPGWLLVWLPLALMLSQPRPQPPSPSTPARSADDLAMMRD
ncbi:O-antigen ligase family protein [Rhodanobacter sp. L36]|uniref:O-antigen ligase family protein n=1 Tax=Rhodanobacter sp. L36 TaxID=1747221 RepID=UPI00131A87E9|nr:O-antigen ligase family protein [Rhodanobacter sp. L36]